VKENQEKDKIGSKPDKKREACQSQEKFKVVAVERGRKTKENKKRMAENAYTYQKLFKFKEKKKREGPYVQFKERYKKGTYSAKESNLYQKRTTNAIAHNTLGD
nr:hypothetical protein [Tanacetum cinerariifolium]